MIDSIAIAQTGLHGYEQGLRTISNNTANLNTPGFKGSVTQFADLAQPDSGKGSGSRFGEAGLGLHALGTSLDFSQGQLQNSSNPLDLAVDGRGFFMLRDEKGGLHYTKDGQFKFNGDGVLVAQTTGEQVMSLDADGNLMPVTLTQLQTAPAQATTTVTFGGNLASTVNSAVVNNVTVIDSIGSSHVLSLRLTTITGQAGQWTVTLLDGSTPVGTATLPFTAGKTVPATSVLAFNYAPAGAAAMALSLDFSSNVTSIDFGGTTTLAMTGQNGHSVGQLNGTSFDDTGKLVLSYSNGQTVKGNQLALAQFDSADDVVDLGSNEYAAKEGKAWQVGVAGGGQFGKVQAGMVEGSNVDLSRQFSDLVIMQRGYQACSQVVSTAGEMLTSLFSMVSK
jgi:flagellar hook protein FlgE